MKRGSIVRLGSSLGFAAVLLVPAGAGGVARAGGPPQSPVRESVAYLTDHLTAAAPRKLRLEPDKNRLARRLHSAMPHGFAGAGLDRSRGAGVLTVATTRLDRAHRIVRRLPHGGAVRVVSVTHALDTVSRFRHRAVVRTGRGAYRRVNVARNRVDVWTDHREQVLSERGSDRPDLAVQTPPPGIGAESGSPIPAGGSPSLITD